MQHRIRSARVDTLGERLLAAMRRTAAGVAIITTRGSAGQGGITVSSFCSLSLEPPSVLVSIKRDSSTLQLILENRVFAANVLAQDQAALAEIFASPAHSHEQRFAEGSWRDEGAGGPTLEGAVAHIDCKVSATFDYGSHTIVIGDVIDAISHQARPLVYAERGFHRLP